MAKMIKKAATAAPIRAADELVCEAADDAYTFIAMALGHIENALLVTAMAQAQRAVTRDDPAELLRMMKRTMAARQKLHRIERDMMVMVKDCEREGS